jgi:hypothetical protein
MLPPLAKLREEEDEGDKEGTGGRMDKARAGAGEVFFARARGLDPPWNAPVASQRIKSGIQNATSRAKK